MRDSKGWIFHPVFVHFPQALFPVAFASFALYLATGTRDFEVGAHLMSGFGVLSVPVAIGTGFFDWKTRYKGYLTSVFKIKIGGAFALAAAALPAVAARALDPDLTLLPLSPAGWIYAGALGICAALCVVLGHYGGRLVFH